MHALHDKCHQYWSTSINWVDHRQFGPDNSFHSIRCLYTFEILKILTILMCQTQRGLWAKFMIYSVGTQVNWLKFQLIINIISSMNTKNKCSTRKPLQRKQLNNFYNKENRWVQCFILIKIVSAISLDGKIASQHGQNKDETDKWKTMCVYPFIRMKSFVKTFSAVQN